MALKERFDADLKAAMLGGDKFRVEVLRGIKSVVLYAEVAEGKRDTGLGDDEIEKVLAKEVKKRDESAQLYDQGGNPTAAQKERDEKKILQEYLPEQLSEEELRKIIDDVAAQIGATDQKGMGQVIAGVRAKTGSRADGALIAKLVKEKLGL